MLGGSSEGHYYNNWFCDQGKRFNATSAIDNYMTTLIQEQALAFLRNHSGEPKFLYVTPHAPHTRATPPPGTDGYFWDAKSPRLPSWNMSVPDHHWLMRIQDPLTEKCAFSSDSLYQNRLRALLGVDDLVKAIADTLVDMGEFDNTYFLYSSDHGFHLGEFCAPYFKAQVSFLLWG